jgi:hypothetical protein
MGSMGLKKGLDWKGLIWDDVGLLRGVKLICMSAASDDLKA